MTVIQVSPGGVLYSYRPTLDTCRDEIDSEQPFAVHLIYAEETVS